MVTYRMIAEDIQRRIKAEEWKPGPDGRVRLPRWREFAAEYNVTPRTIGHAMALLDALGIIHTEQGRGSFLPQVNDPPSSNRDGKGS